jgi:hypothetical protein
MCKDTNKKSHLQLAKYRNQIRIGSQKIRRRDKTISCQNLKLKNQEQDLLALQRKNKELEGRNLYLESLLLDKRTSTTTEENTIKKPTKEFKIPFQQCSHPPDLDKENKARGYHYSVDIITLAIELQVKIGLSYRETNKALGILIKQNFPTYKTPDPTTIRGWVHKFGLSLLKETEKIEGETLLIADESASIGKEKAFLALAVPLDNWREKKGPLTFEDVVVLCVGTKNSWTGDDMQEMLKKGESRLVKTPIGLLADSCNVMLKASRGYLPHNPDCTHKFANCIEHYYKNDEGFKSLMSDVGKFRQKMVNSKDVELISPNLRTKSRFLNLFTVRSWMKRIRNIWETLREDLKEKLSFFQTHQKLVIELCQMIDLVELLSVELKTNGIDPTTRKKVEKIFEQAAVKTDITERFKSDVLQYINLVRKRFPIEESIIVCSDIIESMYGKLKGRCQKICNQGIGKDLLALPIFCKKITKESIKKAMESVKVSDVAEWVTENLVETFGQTMHNFAQNSASPK